ncbi:hypothetical protein RHHCN13_04335 [Rickettsia conorii subsp. heilongjiangensis]|uniref:Uncharacterized protein n=1 Tax=Rickettsia conorii subsp. heilongjiangensis TaxID=226665 RepID=A0AAD1LST8_RICCR|nr:hypothetical protein [Rickettsia conorii]AEK74847.1 hypothetical protein Rh054_04645 [Rickettsia conorii subsp. heilongjiangensis 054]BBM91591.1 hypothetical protein RHCH81_04335 [Rickettsia conorii subsp. heilongjiangensis]BBM92799.1 hypothetical protein RHHCN13_04335 [Rickettsia conorii subsp. heilongjiangensis]BBM94008.1 hypothetical protein RHSENDAI29_04335 [Rickettsia conorii subsp. heilongjiangensis]BBM95217.1 hypothetical protein RHSENDAI58_04335 [Rickettsia conorii subsp. heilongjia
MSKKKQDDQIIKELEERLAKLKGTPPSLEELEERFAKLQDRPYIPIKKSGNEVDDLIEQLQSELKLEQKSKSLNDQKDQAIRDRLDKLREDSPITQKKTPIDLSFNDTKSIITDTIDAQADIASSYANRSTELEEKKALLHLANNLTEARDIIRDIPPISKEYVPKLLDVIASGLGKIYEGIKKIASPAVNIIKEIGSSLVNSIKSLPHKSSKQQIKLKKLYRTYVDLKGIKPKIKEEFLKKHYERIDQLQTPKEIFVETAKITQSIRIAGKQKINTLKQQQIINRMKQQSPTAFINNNSFTPSNTPTNKARSSKNNQR